jgi:hypothetical protein
MNPRWRMLLWEQWRIVRRVYTIIFLAFLVGTLCLRYLVYAEVSAIKNANEFSYLFLYIGLLWGIGTVLLRRTNKGNFAYDFDNRFFLLPISTPHLVVVTLLIRLFMLLLLCIVFMTIKQISFLGLKYNAHAITVLYVYFFFLNAYLYLQVFAWAWKPLKGLMFLILVGMLSFAGIYIVHPEYTNNLLVYALISDNSKYIPILISICAVILCFPAIYFQRQERNSRIPTYYDFVALLNSLGAARADRFSSPFEAQLWYEQRRLGRLLPWSMVIGSVLGVLLLILSEVDFHRDTFILFYAPLFIFLVAVLISGVTILRKFPGSYSFKQPIPATGIALARLLAVARSFFLILFILPVPMFLVLYFYPFERFMLSEALSNKSIDIPYVAAMALQPLLFFGAIAWLMLWWPSPYILRTIIVIMLYVVATFLKLDYFALPLYLPCIILMIYMTAIALSCINALVREKVYSLKQLQLVLIFWLITTAVAVGLSLLSSWSDVMIINTAILVNVTALPFLSVPLDLTRQRFE